MGRQVYCLRSLGNILTSKSLQKYGEGKIGFTPKWWVTTLTQNHKKYDVDRWFLHVDIFYHGATAPVGQGLLIIEDSRSYSDTPHLVGLLWTSDQPDAETSTWQHTTLTRDKHPCPRRVWNPQSQQAWGRKPTPYTVRPLRSALVNLHRPKFAQVPHTTISLVTISRKNHDVMGNQQYL